MSQSELRHLLQVLEERDISLDEGNIARAFENPELRSQLSAWMHAYLSSTTLLTRDELKFAEATKDAQGSAPALRIRASTDVEIESAIASLEASTAAIEKQSRILEVQKTALQNLRARDVPDQPPEDNEPSFQRKVIREQAQAVLEVDEVYQAMNDLVQTGVKQVDTVSSKIRSNVERVLEKDDRLFGGLQKLLPKLLDLAQVSDDTAEIDEMCSALGIISVKEIHAHLDATYRNTISQQSMTSNVSPTSGLSNEQSKQRDHLRAELGELGSEIDGLVAMAINNQYRKPLLRSMKISHAENLNQRTQWSEYTIMTLQYLAARLDILNEHIQHIHGHRAALQAISDTLEQMVDLPPRGKQAPTSPRAVERTPAKGLKPLRLVQENLSEAQDPMIQLLRQLDVRVSDTGSGSLLKVLHSAVKEHQKRSEQISRTTEAAIIDNIATSLSKADTHVQDLLSAVFAHSNYRDVKLLDVDVQAALDQLEEETQTLGDDMRALDTNAMMKIMKSKQAKVVAGLSTWMSGLH